MPAIVLPLLVVLAPGDNLHIAEVDGKSGYVDDTGAMVIAPKFFTAWDFSEGLGPVALEGRRCGYIDPSGRFVIEPKLEDVMPFSEGLAVAAAEPNKYGYIDRTGRFVISPRFRDKPGDFHQGLARVTIKRKDGFINAKGEVVIAARFDGAGDFGDGLAPVGIKGQWGYIDTAGKIVIEPRFAWAGSFSDKRAPVTDGGPSGYIDPTGKVVIGMRYAQAGEFSEGLAAVQSGRGLTFIDPSGKVAVRIGGAWATPFRNGLARVGGMMDGGTWRYVDRQGKTVWDPKNLETQTPSRLVVPTGHPKPDELPVLITLPYTGGTAEGLLFRYVGGRGELPELLTRYQASGWPKRSTASRSFRVMLPPGAGDGGDHSAQGFAAAIERYSTRILADLDRLSASKKGGRVRAVLAGFSLGGDLACALVQKHPDRFAGAIIMGSRCSYRAPENLPKLRAAGVRLVLVMGEREKKVRLDGMARARRDFEAAGISTSYVTVPGGGHVGATHEQFRAALEETLLAGP